MSELTTVQARAPLAGKQPSSNGPAARFARPERPAKPVSAAADAQTHLAPNRTAADNYSTQLLLEKQFGVKLSDIRAKVLEIFRSQGMDSTEIEQLSPADAQAQISVDGYWGVEQTSARIVDFARAAAGSDPNRLEALKAAIQKGFEAAKEVFGGTLPDISQQTLERALARLDDWAAEQPAAPRVNLSV